MPTLETSLTGCSEELSQAIASALARVPPLWPLRHFVAVNPFVGFVNQPFARACTHLERTVGAAPLQSASDYQRAYADGRISPNDLAAACGPDWTPAKLHAELQAALAETAKPPMPTVADWLDQSRPQAHWGAFVADEISKWCAVSFDENQTTWNSPWKTMGLFAAWHEAALHDRNPEAFGLVGFRSFVAELPSDPASAIVRCLGTLQPPRTVWADFLHRQLCTIAGWAGYAQYLAREDALRGRSSDVLRDLLAIRLAYDAALFRAFLTHANDRPVWRTTDHQTQKQSRFAALACWQTAYEIGYQASLGRALATQPPATSGVRPSAQAIFCIDVRSEVFRRHLEAAWPEIVTGGFAGFFGFPIAHRPAGAERDSARCPVLLVPPVETREALTPAEASVAAAARTEAGAWKAFQNSAASCFTFVESAGLAFSAALGRARSPAKPRCEPAAPDFAATSLEERANLAAGALRNMGLVRNVARLVLLCGHGSRSANNPHASGLDCGACGGHAGDVNARIAAATLNDPAIRRQLSLQGITVPDDTFFLAGLHNTTTDDVILFNLESVPATHLADLVNLRRALALAGAATRRERAPALGLTGLPDDQVDAAVRNLAVDIAQVRPEWGLANNAAFIAAPRARTARLKLDGRTFLQDYDSDADTDSKVLTLILCAPVVVASWINLQYYASRIDPLRYGAGNKVLHNVVGGIGVVEGNGGDLKVGLPLQSIHDGTKFIHEPRRLAVYLDAPPAKILAVLQQHPDVKQLFDHEWIHLWSIHGDQCHRYAQGTWQPGHAIMATES